MSRKEAKVPADYGPQQAPARLGLDLWQWERALRDRLIPAADVRGGRWSAAVVDAALIRVEEIRRATGGLPDCGASRAADVLTERFGVDVHRGAVVELARTGAVPCIGEYKGRALYDGRALAGFADREALDRALCDGRLYTRDQVAGVLDVRASDVGHLVRTRWLVPVDWADNRHVSRRRGRESVPLYRHADLTQLLADPAIDWTAVRSTPAGRCSALASLPVRLAEGA